VFRNVYVNACFWISPIENKDLKINFSYSDGRVLANDCKRCNNIDNWNEIYNQVGTYLISSFEYI